MDDVKASISKESAVGKLLDHGIEAPSRIRIQKDISLYVLSRYLSGNQDLCGFPAL